MSQAVRRLALALALALALTPAHAVVVGSKQFTESVILGEILTQWLRAHGIAAEHRRELGGTRILWNATLRGDVDVYPEYTGTIRREILAGQTIAPEPEALSDAVRALGAALGAPLGFSNNYGLAVTAAVAARHRLTRISDVAAVTSLRVAFTSEFMRRGDGWPGLAAHYALPHVAVGMDHDLAYRALAAGQIDLTDVYTTDAEIDFYGLRVLHDDRAYFDRYDAVLVSRADLDPDVRVVLDRLAGRIDTATMMAMNRAVKIDGVSDRVVAAEYLQREFGLRGDPQPVADRDEAVWRATREHLVLTATSLGAAIAVAVPLGVLVARRPRASAVVLASAGVLQTIPSLALLVMLVPLAGIGAAPAVIALFLYSLLPILRNTVTGLNGIAPDLDESAEALGLGRGFRLWHIDLPLALPAILAGIKTSAVINVGTATLGALVGAGGYGQPILTGIRLDDTGLILSGAIPAAVLALVVQAVFAGIESLLTPQGMRR